MQIRYRVYDDELDRYKLISYTTDVKDYDIMYKLFCYMKDNNCEYAVELNLDDNVESSDIKSYRVVGVSLCIPNINGELLPHISVDLEEEF